MYHMNENGDVNVCTATVKECPLGRANHFEEELAAYVEFSKRMKEAFPLTGIKKALKPTMDKPKRSRKDMNWGLSNFLENYDKHRDWLEQEIDFFYTDSQCKDQVHKEVYFKALDAFVTAYSHDDTEEGKLMEAADALHKYVAPVTRLGTKELGPLIGGTHGELAEEAFKIQSKFNSSVEAALESGVYCHPNAGEELTDHAMDTYPNDNGWLRSAYMDGKPSVERLVGKAGHDSLGYWSPENLDRLRQQSMVNPQVAQALAVKDPQGSQRKAAFDLLIATNWDDLSEYQLQKVLQDTPHYLASAESKQALTDSIFEWAETYADPIQRGNLEAIARKVGVKPKQSAMARREPEAEPKRKRWFS